MIFRHQTPLINWIGASAIALHIIPLPSQHQAIARLNHVHLRILQDHRSHSLITSILQIIPQRSPVSGDRPLVFALVASLSVELLHRQSFLLKLRFH